jgi:hypothetical protein
MLSLRDSQTDKDRCMRSQPTQQWYRAELDAIERHGPALPALQHLGDLLRDLIEDDPPVESLPEILVTRACSADARTAQPAAILLYAWLNS